jgi:hypothetical protein
LWEDVTKASQAALQPITISHTATPEVDKHQILAAISKGANITINCWNDDPNIYRKCQDLPM